MSEATIATPTIDATTGEVVGGLAGLREIMKMRQELNATGDNAVTPSTGHSSNAVTETSASADTTEQPRKSRRRNRRRRDGGNSPEQSSFTLPIKPSQVVYAEIIGRPGMPEDVRMYVSGDERLYVHTSAVYMGRARDYCVAAKKLLTNQSAFDMAKVADVQLFINKRAELIVMDDFLVYMDKYRIDSSNEKVFNMAKKLLDERAKRSENDRKATNEDSQGQRSGDVVVYSLKAESSNQGGGEIKLPKEKLSQVAREIDEQAKQTAPAKSATVSVAQKANKVDAKPQLSIVDKVTRVQELADRAATGEVSIAVAMETFLLVGEASPELLVQLLHLDYAVAVDLVGQLRLMHAIGHQVDGEKVTYPILIDDLKDLGKDVAYTLQSTEENFHSVIDVVTVRNKELYYDLDAVLAVQMADEYIHRLAEFCRVTRSHRIGQLFGGTAKRVAASEVLQALSDDDKGDVYGEKSGDFALFHDYVTKGMLTAGWLVGNPSDGYPWVQFQVAGTRELTIDTLRYVVANVDWLVASYDVACVRSLIEQIRRLSLSDNDKRLQKAVIMRLQKLLEQYDADQADSIDARQLSLDNYDSKVTQNKHNETKQD